MPGLLSNIFRNIALVFKGKNLLWQGIMIALTALLVISGADWWYYVVTRNTSVQSLGFMAGMLGFLVPIILVLVLVAVGDVLKNKYIKYAGYAAAQAGILGLAISSSYKVFTGRTGLPHNIITDTSEMFRFGIMRGGAFHGWQSSHTSVEFGLSIAICMLFPKKKLVWVIAISYAFLIGLGASVGFHWLSDFAAGIILGTTIGIVVGKSFLDKLGKTKPA